MAAPGLMPALLGHIQYLSLYMEMQHRDDTLVL